MKRLGRKFFEKPTLKVAKELLGKFLVRRIGNKLIKARITETEAYCGSSDLACHASKGLTERTKVMFGPAGFSYVYMIYGMYHCLNVVTEPDGIAGAVLIRAVDSVNTNGPGKICREWKIDLQHNGKSLMEADTDLWICPGERISSSKIVASPRVGISLAIDLPWRFSIRGHKSVSRPASKDN